MADGNVKNDSSEDIVQIKNLKNTELEAEPNESYIAPIEEFQEEPEIINEDEGDQSMNEEESLEEEEMSDFTCPQANVVEIQFSDEEIAAGKSVAKSIQAFTHKFHESIANETEGNFVCSGLSAHTVLSMAAQGAEGTTAEKLRQGLFLPEDQQETCIGYQCYIKKLTNAHKMVFKLANKIYMSSNKELKESFKNTTATYFNSESESIDFSKSKDATEKMNDWCSKTTDGKIRNIISEKDIDRSTNFVLLNALYFKGIWKKKFLHMNTTMKPYHIDKETIKEVPMMYNKTYYWYNELEDESAHVIGIPYQNENYRMFIIVPKEIEGLANVEKNYEQVKKAFDTLEHTRRITLHLPRFKISSTINLQPHLCQMGMEGIFHDDADFNGITDHSGGVTRVHQRVFIEVNEDGTEALCFTDYLHYVKYDHNVPLELTVDRPFLYQIYDMANGILIFSGRIIDPSAAENNC